VLTSSQQTLSRWITPPVLITFLGLLIQPQFAALYHTHRGGDHVHVHVQPHVSQANPHEHPHHHGHSHHHPHQYHQHSHTDGFTPIHRQTDHSPSFHTTPTYRPAPVHSNGHWHTSITLHQTTLASAPPSSPGLCIQLLTPEEHTFPALSPPQYCQPRAPPFSR